MCHENKTAPCVYVGLFINKSVFHFFLSGHFYLKELNQLHFQGLTSALSHMAELHCPQMLQISATYNRAYVLWVLRIHTFIFPIKNIVLPQRPRWHNSSSNKTVTTFIHSHANIVLGTAKYWDYKNDKDKRDSHNVDIDNEVTTAVDWTTALWHIAFYII